MGSDRRELCWGQGGYGWLPYDYIIQGLTADWWSLLKAEWLATGRFGAGASAWNPDKGGEKGVLTGQ
jgi:C1A family cysteine protease